MGLGILISVIAFLVLMALHGYRKGFINLSLSMVVVVISLIISNIAAPIITSSLGNSGIYKSLNAPINSYVEEKLDLEIKDAEEKHIPEVKAGEYENKIDKLKLPQSVKGFINNVVEDKDPVSMAAKGFTSVIADALTVVILNAIVFLVLFLVFFVLLKIIVGVLNIVSKLPIINLFNKSLGLTLSLCEALIVIWLLCLVLLIIKETTIGKEIMDAVQNNAFLQLLYNRNLLARGLMHFIK